MIGRRTRALVPVAGLLKDLWRKIESKAEYNRAHASLSRALTRLWQRGLVEIWKSVGRRTGVTLAVKD